MGLVSTWLTGIGLAHAVPNFRAAGIVTPSDLAELDLSHYEALGVREASDRKKLFYLVQRIKMAVDEENGSPNRKGLREEERRLGAGKAVGESSSSSSGDYEEEEEEEYEDDYCSEGVTEDEAAGASASKAARGGGGKGKGKGTYGGGKGVYDASETASASSDSSDLPAPPPEERLDESYRSVGSRSVAAAASAPADEGRRRSTRIRNIRRGEHDAHQQQSHRPAASSLKRSEGRSAMTKKKSLPPPPVHGDDSFEDYDEADEDDDLLSALSPSSQATTDENHRSDNDRVAPSRKSFGSSRASAAAAEKLADRRKGRAGAATATSLNKSAEVSEDDSDWDELLGPSAATTSKSKPVSSTARRRLAAEEVEEDLVQDPADSKSSSRRTSQRLRAKQRQERGKYGLQSISSSFSADRSDDDDDDDADCSESVISAMSYGSTTSAMSARELERRRRSAPLAAGGGSTSATSKAKSNRRKTSSFTGANRCPGTSLVEAEEHPPTRARSRLEELQAARLARSRSGGEAAMTKSKTATTTTTVAATVSRSFDECDLDNDDDDAESRASRTDMSVKSLDSSSYALKPSAVSKPRAGLKMPAKSRIPGPAVSTTGRRGKRLSTIPSNRVPPMSPLLSMSASQLDRSIGAKKISSLAFDDDNLDEEEDDDDDQSTSSVGSRGRGRSRRVSAGGGRTSSSTSRERRRSLSDGDSSASVASSDRKAGLGGGRRSSGRRVSGRVQPPLGSITRSRSDSGDASAGGDAKVGRKTAAAAAAPLTSSRGGGRRRSSARRDVSTAGDSSVSSLGSRRSRLQTPSVGSPKRRTAAASAGRSDSASMRSLDSSFHSSYHGGGGADASYHASSDFLNESVSSSAAGGPIFVHGMPEDDSFKTQIATMREDNASEHEERHGHLPLESEDTDDDEMRIRVIVRKRPMSKKEAERSDEVDVIHPLDCDGYGRVLVYQPKTRVDLTKEVETLPFAFDNVFDEVSDNTRIYERAVRGLIPGVFEGRWASVFAYGQTGSGKTFTMMGSNLTGVKAGTADDSNLGLYYLAAQDMFYLANEPEFRHLTVGASLFEIYGGKLFDLLNCRKPIKCLEDHRGKVCFPGLSEHPVSSASELMDAIEAGAANRSTGTTSANADSSRSHAVLQLSLRKTTKQRGGGRPRSVEHGRLTFIDLAGSERGADTNKASRTTRMEGAEINTSLLALKEVIRALATGDSMTHIPFRGSKLTQVLKESFVGKNSRSVMVACVAPNMGNCEHTLNTLRYADRVKERDAQTGKLTAAVARASRIRSGNKGGRAGGGGGAAAASARIPRRPITAPASSGDLNRLMKSQSGSESESGNVGRYDVSRMESDDEDDEEDWLTSDVEAAEVLREEPSVDEDSLAIDEVLDDSAEDTGAEPQVEMDTNSERMNDYASSRAAENGFGVDRSQPPQADIMNKEAAKTLISTHREIMTEMLSMVKHEMTLVNCTDSDRETIEEYLGELENAQDKHLSMISTLREALLDYYGSRQNPSGHRHPPTQMGQAKQPDAGFLSDDSFEDLRD